MLKVHVWLFVCILQLSYIAYSVHSICCSLASRVVLSFFFQCFLKVFGYIISNFFSDSIIHDLCIGIDHYSIWFSKFKQHNEPNPTELNTEPRVELKDEMNGRTHTHTHRKKKLILFGRLNTHCILWYCILLLLPLR